MSVASLSAAGMILGGLVVIASIRYARPGLLTDVLRSARRRWVLGLPLGTIVVVSLNLAGYGLLQGGLLDAGEPLALPFYSWSYRYPLGLLTSPLTHAGPGHLVGNLTSAAVLLPAVEYVVGHRGADRPLRRALVTFPLAMYGVGVAVSALSWGPVIGFSGVLFVLIGFLLVVAPYGAVAALLASRIVEVVASAAMEPVVRSTPGSEFVTPWWANVAVESHALGVMLGVALGVLYARRRRIVVDGVRTAVAFVVVAAMQSLWAVWMTTQTGFVLYRAAGVGLTAVGAVLLGALVAIETPADPLIRQERVELLRIVVLVGFVLPILTFAGVAVVINASGIADTGPEEAVVVQDYHITYGENVTNGWIKAVPYVDLSMADGRADGVIVWSQKRSIWIEQVAADELRQTGSSSFRIGGLRWQQRVTAERRGMTTNRGNESFAVAISVGEGDRWVQTGRTAWSATTVDGWRVGLRQSGPDRQLLLRNGGVTRSIALRRDEPTATAGVTARIRDDGSIAVATDGASTTVGTVT